MKCREKFERILGHIQHGNFQYIAIDGRAETPTPLDRKKALEHVLQCKQFYFIEWDPQNMGSEIVTGKSNDKVTFFTYKGVSSWAPRDLPFNACFFAAENDFLAKNDISSLQKQDPNLPDDLMYIDAVCVIETSPSNIVIYALNAYGVTGETHRKEVGERSPNYYDIFIEQINSRKNQTAILPGRIKLKIKDPVSKEKKFHLIKDIIMIKPKKLKISHPEISQDIDWSHRWRVMGHWRKIEGIGKNREGSYDVNGYTWVVDYIRGPEGLPLIEKKRIVAGIPKGE